MKKIILIFLASWLISCKTIYINAWQAPMSSCDVYVVTKIEFGPDNIYPGISPDTISVMYVTIQQASYKYKIDGPDYCLLSVINEKSDTVAGISMNGLPTHGKPRTYPAYSKSRWKIKPDLSKIHVSLPPYCDRIIVK